MFPARNALLLWCVCSMPLGVAAAAAGATAAPAATSSHHEEPDPGATRTLLEPGVTDSIPMDLHMGQPIVEVILDGRGPYRMFLDTGAGSTVLDRSLAVELGLRRVGTTRIGDPANPEAIAADLVMIDSLAIGGVRFEGVRATSWDRSELRGVADAPLGVLGFALFRELLLTLDYPRSQVRLARGRLPAADGRTVLRYTDSDGIPSVPVEIAGARFEAHLDTGSPGLLSIPERDSSRVRFAEPLRVVGHGRTVNSQIVLRGATIDGAVAIGQHRIERPMVLVHDRLPEANLGGGALRDFVLTFDQRAKSVRFDRTRVSPPEAYRPPAHAAGPEPPPATPPGGKTLGLRLAPQPDGSLVVVATDPGSIASRADIAAGDRVLKIDGTPIDSLSDDARRAALHRSPVTLTLARGERTIDVRLEF